MSFQIPTEFKEEARELFASNIRHPEDYDKLISRVEKSLSDKGMHRWIKNVPEGRRKERMRDKTRYKILCYIAKKMHDAELGTFFPGEFYIKNHPSLPGVGCTFILKGDSYYKMLLEEIQHRKDRSKVWSSTATEEIYRVLEEEIKVSYSLRKPSKKRFENILSFDVPDREYIKEFSKEKAEEFFDKHIQIPKSYPSDVRNSIEKQIKSKVSQKIKKTLNDRRRLYNLKGTSDYFHYIPHGEPHFAPSIWMRGRISDFIVNSEDNDDFIFRNKEDERFESYLDKENRDNCEIYQIDIDYNLFAITLSSFISKTLTQEEPIISIWGASLEESHDGLLVQIDKSYKKPIGKGNRKSQEKVHNTLDSFIDDSRTLHIHPSRDRSYLFKSANFPVMFYKRVMERVWSHLEALLPPITSSLYGVVF